MTWARRSPAGQRLRASRSCPVTKERARHPDTQLGHPRPCRTLWETPVPAGLCVKPCSCQTLCDPACPGHLRPESSHQLGRARLCHSDKQAPNPCGFTSKSIPPGRARAVWVTEDPLDPRDPGKEPTVRGGGVLHLSRRQTSSSEAQTRDVGGTPRTRGRTTPGFPFGRHFHVRSRFGPTELFTRKRFPSQA